LLFPTSTVAFSLYSFSNFPTRLLLPVSPLNYLGLITKEVPGLLGVLLLESPPPLNRPAILFDLIPREFLSSPPLVLEFTSYWRQSWFSSADLRLFDACDVYTTTTTTARHPLARSRSTCCRLEMPVQVPPSPPPPPQLPSPPKFRILYVSGILQTFYNTLYPHSRVY
jgi:hypothetical protein